MERLAVYGIGRRGVDVWSFWVYLGILMYSQRRKSLRQYCTVIYHIFNEKTMVIIVDEEEDSAALNRVCGRRNELVSSKSI